MNMTEKEKYGKYQVVRVLEDHDCNGIKLQKGMVGYVYPGETYETLAPNEIAIAFTFLKQGFLGVSRDKIEPFRGDMGTLSAQAGAYEALEYTLRSIQQTLFDRNSLGAVGTILEMRRFFHVKSMVDILGWSTTTAQGDFDGAERVLEAVGAPPYQAKVK